MPISLVPVGEQIPAAVVAETPSMATVETPPPKRGRGRPKGSLNKPKVVNLSHHQTEQKKRSQTNRSQTSRRRQK